MTYPHPALHSRCVRLGGCYTASYPQQCYTETAGTPRSPLRLAPSSSVLTTHALRARKADDYTPPCDSIATAGHVLSLPGVYSPNLKIRSRRRPMQASRSRLRLSGMVLRIVPNERPRAGQGKSYLSRECTAAAPGLLPSLRTTATVCAQSPSGACLRLRVRCSDQQQADAWLSPRPEAGA